MEKEQDNFETFVSSSIADGVAAGIYKFLVGNNVNLKPGTKSKKPLSEFVIQFTAEFVAQQSLCAGYPFTKSFRDVISSVIVGARGVLQTVYDSGEIDNLKSLCRVIGQGEAVKFLDENRPEVLKYINGLRGDDIINGVDPHSQVN